MKRFLLLCVVGLLLSSCSTIYYQVYKVQPINDSSKSNNSLCYEDENCIVCYDFWGNGGSVRFLVFNKTTKNMYIDMKESFFIRDGIAYDYFLNREFTSSASITSSFTTSQSSMYTNSATSTYGVMASRANSVAVSGYDFAGFRQTNAFSAGVGTVKIAGLSASKSLASSETTVSSKTLSSGVNIREKDIVCIPSKTSKIISEYNINKKLYIDSNLHLYPSAFKSDIKTSHFSEELSPLVFSNRISYIIEGNENAIKIEHKFYVSEISNYPNAPFTGNKKDRLYEEQSSGTKTSSVRKTSSVGTTRYVSPDNSSYFYIKYFD